MQRREPPRPDPDPARAAGGAAQPAERPLARAALDRRKRRDAAIALPIAGVVLFASPLLDLTAGAGNLAGIPLAVLYVFGTWFALIWATASLARRLIDDDTGESGEGGEP
jgi:hypothetical protein